MSKSRERAVVLGGSIAGLLAARVLADEYADVTVVERDLLPDTPAGRRGVPHGLHTHALLPRGGAIVEDLFPGLTAGLVADGALVGDVLADAHWYVGGRLLRPARTGLPVISGTRALLEGAIRSRLRELPNVRILDGWDIAGVGASDDGRRIVSARVTSLHGLGSWVLPADVVVDATGRGSRTPRWLTDLGYTAPVEDRVRIDLAYATRLFELPPGMMADRFAVVTARFPGQHRSAVMQRVEGDRVMVTLAGVLGQRPPAELADFIGYAKTLAVPDTYELVRAARPVGSASTFRVPVYSRRRYEQLTDFPAGLLVTGDAACAFNPVYAQGMTVAALDALTLRDELRRSGSDAPDPARFFAELARSLEAPWNLAVGQDLAIPGVVGPPLPPSPLTPEYMNALRMLATQDPAVSTAFMRVAALVDPPSALMHPSVAARVEAAMGALVP
jgi:2-polyprenyl-6-methoxyphenol hydroxylase-like FAD-dependent oxidoreductase